jgi:lysophospholipase L1-like esterase
MPVCIFGDSIAFGYNDTEKGGWVQRLRNFFETNDYDISLYNCSVSGDTTEDVLKRFKVESQARDAEMIIFAIGINDSRYINSKDNPAVPADQFQKNLQELINQAKKFTKKIIFLGLTNIVESKVMPIPWQPDEYYDQENVKIYNQHLKTICEKNNLPFLDMLDLLDDLELDDGLHPEPSGHEKIYLKVKDYILSNKLLKK